MVQEERNQVLEILENWIKLSQSELDQFFDICETQTLKKHEFFTEKGKPAFHEAVVIDGVVRGFHRNPDGDEINTVFYTHGNVIAPWFSRTNTQVGTSYINLQALTEVKLAIFTAEKFYQLMTENLGIRTFGQLVVERELLYRTEREIMGISLNASERLEKFREIHPGLENLISQIQIAQYIGITPVSLSRLRGQ